jgi:glucose/arabinose dehydrogenase
MKRRQAVLWSLVAALSLGSCLVGAPRPALAAIASQEIISGLNVPSFVTSPPGDSGRIFITELNTGKIHIYKNGALLPTAFLRVPSVSTGNERGLLGLAFHPQYAQNGYFYVHYTSAVTGGAIVARYTRSANPDIADSTSAAVILSFPPPQAAHVGGWIGFGPDGYLYIAKGDAFTSANAQSMTSPFGKVLRIDVDSAFPYAIPPTNPFAGDPAPANLFWCLGLRNPWRCSFDRGTGDFYIADVGEGDFEEIDYQLPSSPGGENYGWPMFEGNMIFDCPDPCDSSGLTFPLLPIAHSPNSPFFCAVTGGYVYRGAAIPGLAGTYFYGDYCSGQIWSLRVVDGEPTEITNRVPELDPMGSVGIDLVISFGEDGRGELYICDLVGGEVFKIINDVTGVGPGEGVGALTLGPPSPNPCVAGARFRVALASDEIVRAAVYDASGRRVRSIADRLLPRGDHILEWDARDDHKTPVPPGTYLIRVESSSLRRSQKISVVR